MNTQANQTNQDSREPTVLRVLLLDDNPDGAIQTVRSAVVMAAPDPEDMDFDPPWNITFDGQMIRVEVSPIFTAREAQAILRDHQRLMGFDLVLLDVNWERDSSLGLSHRERARWGMETLLRMHTELHSEHPPIALYTHYGAADMVATAIKLKTPLIGKANVLHLLSRIFWAIDRLRHIGGQEV
ncbi:MAG: hypothetical protein MJE77_18025 [Proteobacteria bacterium]|nr:hypothetical protein [Pseudomonadota bacterium]